MFDEDRLEKLFGIDEDHGIKLAFVSACHSEKIADILQTKCNIPLVISVNKSE